MGYPVTIYDAKTGEFTMAELESTEKDDEAIRKYDIKARISENARPLTEAEVTRMLICLAINSLTVDDSTALRMTDFYPEWDAGQTYTAGFKVQHGGKLWRCLQAHTSQSSWEPSTATASLWEQICETHDGTLDDPIPYEGNMTLESGKYYIQDYVIYLCNRDTINPVYNALADLVGLYVEKVAMSASRATGAVQA